MKLRPVAAFERSLSIAEDAPDAERLATAGAGGKTSASPGADNSLLSDLLMELPEPGPTPASPEAAARFFAADAAFVRLVEAVGADQRTETVAVLDSGMAWRHPFLAARVWTNAQEIAGNGLDDDHNGKVDDVHGWDFVNGQPNVDQAPEHGTHVAGILTRGTDRVRAMPLKVINPLSGSAVREAIDYAAAAGVRVVNLSFVAAGTQLVAEIKAAMAAHPEMLFVKSAGNSGMKLGGFWCSVDGDNHLSANRLPNMLVVANADERGKRARDSNYGERFVDVAAPGTHIASCGTNGDLVLKSGTSMSCPLVAGLAAKCLILHPALTVADLKRLIGATCDQTPAWAHRVASGGVINAERALTLAALGALIAGGVVPAAAADHLALSGPERERLLTLALPHPAR